jgi:DNA polymerase III delta prime subunit
MKTFINKYKPQLLKDFGYDYSFINIISTFIEIDSLNVLIVGPVSSGKTTLLYSLVREYYGRECSIHDVLYINNISEQGISFFRNEMKTFCQSHCSIFGKKKMIIVDDLDLISEQSQQIFRNYIDKYPIMFVSVCTNIKKIIECLQSRLHIMNINPPSLKQQSITMNTILLNEKINIDQKTKEYLLSSTSNIRTLINNLETIFIYSDNENEFISFEEILSLCTKSVSFDNYINCLKNKDLNNAIKNIYDIFNYGYSVIDILEFFFYFVKTTELLNEDEKYKIIPIICNYISIFYNTHEHEIELSLLTNSISKIICV